MNEPVIPTSPSPNRAEAGSCCDPQAKREAVATGADCC